MTLDRSMNVNGKTPVLLSWSGGKDCTLALYELLCHTDSYAVVALLATITRDYDRLSMHGVRRSLIERQAASLELKLDCAMIPKEASNRVYEEAMRERLHVWRERGVRTVAFGDLFLEDVRAYRERMLAALDMQGLFPLWARDTRQCAARFLALGFRAAVVCVDGRRLDQSFAGRFYDADFVRDLPPDVDPCGENGEFHTFVFAGPIFRRPIEVEFGEKVRRGDFVFCDLVERP